MSSGKRHKQIILIKVFALLSIIRWLNILLTIFAQYLAAVFILNPNKTYFEVLSNPKLHLMTLASAFIIAGGYIINNFYDLEKDQSSELLLYPFCSMDITPLHYYKLSPEQAIEKNLELLNRVKAVNGVFISLWHNESLSGTGRWEGGWTKVYEQLLKDAETLTDKK